MSADYIKRQKANTLRHFISLFRPFMGSITYFFKSNIDGFRTIWQHWVKTPLSDTGTALSIIITFLSGFILYKAKNKNLAKNFNFFYAMLQMVLAVLSGLSLAGTSLAIAISAMALNIVYSLGMFVYSFYKYKSYAKENTVQNLMLQQIYKKAMIKHAVLFAISLFVLSSFLVVSVFFPVVAAAASLSVGLATSIMLLGLGIYSAYCFFHFSKQSIENQAAIAEKSKLTNSIPKNDSSAIIDNKRAIFSDSSKKAIFEYYQVNEKIAQLTGNSEQDRKALILEAYKNILQLQQQIFKARARGGGGFWSQESKRLAKLDFYKKSLVFLLPASPSKAYLYLNSIKELVEPDIIRLNLLYKSGRYALIQEKLIEVDKSTGYYSEGQLKKYLNSLKQSVYQSFFRNIGNVEAFINALENYFEKETKQEEDQEKIVCISSPRSTTL